MRLPLSLRWRSRFLFFFFFGFFGLSDDISRRGRPVSNSLSGAIRSRSPRTRTLRKCPLTWTLWSRPWSPSRTGSKGGGRRKSVGRHGGRAGIWEVDAGHGRLCPFAGPVCVFVGGWVCFSKNAKDLTCFLKTQIPKPLIRFSKNAKLKTKRGVWWGMPFFFFLCVIPHMFFLHVFFLWLFPLVFEVWGIPKEVSNEEFQKRVLMRNAFFFFFLLFLMTHTQKKQRQKQRHCF